MAENEEKEENLEEGLDENLMQSDLFRDTILKLILLQQLRNLKK